jgi:hypothetical protein
VTDWAFRERRLTSQPAAINSSPISAMAMGVPLLASPMDLMGAGSDLQPDSGVRLTCGQKGASDARSPRRGLADGVPTPAFVAGAPVPALAMGVADEDAAGRVPGDELAAGEPLAGLPALPAAVGLPLPMAVAAARSGATEGATRAPAGGEPVGMTEGTAVGTAVWAVDWVGLVARPGRDPINDMTSAVQKPTSLSVRSQAPEANVDILPPSPHPVPWMPHYVRLYAERALLIHPKRARAGPRSTPRCQEQVQGVASLAKSYHALASVEHKFALRRGRR